MSFDTLGTIKSATGLGAGLDIQGLVSQLVDLEGKYKTEKLEQDEEDTKAEISGYGDVKSKLSALQDSLDKLQNASTFQARKTAVSNDPASDQSTTFFTATATGSSLPTTYDIEVTQLAKAHKLSSAVFNTESTIIGEGTLSITKGFGQDISTTYDFTIDSGNNTVAGIKEAINARTGTTGIAATLITTDAGVQLVISTNEPGVKNTLDIAVTDDDGNDSDNAGLSQLITANMTVQQAPLDAIISIDGQAVTSSSNRLVDTIEGVTLELLKAEAGRTHTLTINNDPEAAKALIEEFVTAYNEYLDVIQGLTNYDEFNQEDNGILIGDSVLRNINTQVNNALLDTRVDASGIVSFASIGLLTNATTGKLEIDEDTLDAKLNSNFDSVASMLGDDTDGIATQMYDLVENLLNSEGLITLRTDALIQDLRDIEDDQIENELKLDRLEVDLTLQFAALDALLGQFQNVSDKLAADLGNFVDPLSFKK